MRLLVLSVLVAAGCFPSPNDMAQVPSGILRMGCNDAVDTQCAADEKPAHDVPLAAFLIDVRKVSQRDYATCIGQGACSAPAANFDPDAHADRPVRSVSWVQAVQYCQWANKRLPTEAEREFAARSSDGRIYPWGNDAPDCDHANFTPASGPCVTDYPTTSVDGRPRGAGPYAAIDLAGNLWEWTADWYAADAYTNGTPSTGTERVVRGGSFRSSASDLRASRRGSRAPDAAADDVGFRCARDPQPAD